MRKLLWLEYLFLFYLLIALVTNAEIEIGVTGSGPGRFCFIPFAVILFKKKKARI